MKNKISVLMCTYNEPIQWISETIDSVLNQSLKPDEFIIVVDNPDNREIKGFLKEAASKNGIFKVIENEKNLGLVKSLNKGLGYCSGDYIARIDADDIALSNRFETQLRFLENNDLDLVGAGFHVFYEEKIYRTINGVENCEHCRQIMKYNSIIAHPTWFMKKTVPDVLGGYREIDSCEDLDFLQRAVLAGFKVANVKEPLLKYRDNPNSISHVKKTKQFLLKTMLCNGYRKGISYTEQEVNDYISSEKYKRDFARKELYDRINEGETGGIRKILGLIGSGVLDIEVKIRLRNLKLNYWKNK